MATTKYKGVCIDAQGRFYYQTELGTDRVTGKRIRKKGRKNLNGKPFTSAHEAFKELTRIRNEYFKAKGYANYNITYGQFMDDVYIPAYQTDVEESTFLSRKGVLERIRDRFTNTPLRSLTYEQVQNYRTWLLSKDGAGYSQSYAGLVFGMFRKSLDMAVNMQYLEVNISKKVKAIPKSKAIVPYWSKRDFEKVISTICIDDFYEHLNFVMLWVYYTTGLRVNEGTALWWEDVDFQKKRLRVHHMLIIKNKHDWQRHDYTKTVDGKRTIALDDDTLEVLRVWKERQSKIGIDDFIFSYDGSPMLKSTISKIIARYSQLAGVRRIQAKGLRHSHASYLINEFNVSVLILSKRMGHSSPEITLKHYAHLWSGADAQIAAEMTGNITIKTAQKKGFKFTGNQAIKVKSFPTKNPTKVLQHA